jgi:hypothetical protein
MWFSRFVKLVLHALLEKLRALILIADCIVILFYVIIIEVVPKRGCGRSSIRRVAENAKQAVGDSRRRLIF